LPGHFFLASARFVEKKNLPRLLQAYARYRELALPSDLRPLTSAPWSLVLLGDGPLKADLCHLIAKLSLQDSVLLPGFKQYDELPSYYAQAQAFIHASTTEQWGLVVNEAMASGLPVLVSNRCGCAHDLVQDGVNGFTFDPRDVEQMAQLMLKISAFNFPLSEFGAASRKIISEFGPDRFASGLQQAVATALRAPPPKPTIIDRLLLRLLLLR
jgi:glycosyltransferase involved in cell wall biosynthesis